MTRRRGTHRRSSRWRGTQWRRPAFARALICVLLALILVTTGGLPSMASWTAAGSGFGSAATATLAAPTGVTVPTNGTSAVPVSWTAGSAPGAPSELRYYVTRTTGAVTTAACGSTPTAPITAISCTDTAVPDGTHSYTVTAVYRSWTARSAASGTITVLTATKLAFSTGPGNAVAGVTGSPTTAVRLQSAAGLPVSTSNIAITVAIAINPSTGTLSGTRVVNTDANGVATFTSLSVDKAGIGYTLTATSGSLTSATSGAFTVTAATSVATLTITTPARSAAASTTANLGAITVEARDANGNLITAPTGGIPLTLTSTSPGIKVFSLTAGGTSTTAVAITAGGTSASFYYGDTKAGVPTITVSSGTLAQTTQAVTVRAAAAKKFVITTAAVSGVASDQASLGPFTLQLQDTFGNPAVAAASITANLSYSAVTLPPTAPARIATFSATLEGPASNAVTLPAGSSSLNFYYGDTFAGTPTVTAGGGTMEAAAQVVTVREAEARQFVITTAPTTGVASNTATVGPFVIKLQDRFGNLAVAPSGGIAAGLSSSPGSFPPAIPARITVFSAVSGGTGPSTVTIPAGDSTAAFYYGDTMAAAAVTLTASKAGFTAGTRAVAITAGVAAKIVVGDWPTQGASGENFAPFTAQIRDTFDNLTTSTATLTVDTVLDKGKLKGIFVKNAVAGQATFDAFSYSGGFPLNLIISTPGTPPSGPITATSGSITR